MKVIFDVSINEIVKIWASWLIIVKCKHARGHDETGLFYKVLPRRTLLHPTEDPRSTRGNKQDKSRITLVLCVNATGSERLPVAIVGRAKRPHAFCGRPKCPLPVCSLFIITIFFKKVEVGYGPAWNMFFPHSPTRVCGILYHFSILSVVIF